MKPQRLSQIEDIKLPNGHYRKGEAGSWKDDLDILEKYLFDKIAGDLLINLEYDERDWWHEKSWHKFFIPIYYLFYNTMQKFKLLKTII